MKNNNIKLIIIFLLIFPIVISIILSCSNFNDKVTASNNSDSIVDGLYIPDTINNREEHIVRKNNYFTYICLFGLLSLFGIAYITLSAKKDKK